MLPIDVCYPQKWCETNRLESLLKPIFHISTSYSRQRTLQHLLFINPSPTLYKRPFSASFLDISLPLYQEVFALKSGPMCCSQTMCFSTFGSFCLGGSTLPSSCREFPFLLQGLSHVSHYSEIYFLRWPQDVPSQMFFFYNVMLILLPSTCVLCSF